MAFSQSVFLSIVIFQVGELISLKQTVGLCNVYGACVDLNVVLDVSEKIGSSFNLGAIRSFASFLSKVNVVDLPLQELSLCFGSVDFVYRKLHPKAEDEYQKKLKYPQIQTLDYGWSLDLDRRRTRFATGDDEGSGGHRLRRRGPRIHPL
ncbi:hypothetical protein Ddye_020842 [Dipteronia dyeriana]|uniref:Uncharacterized protein n=1 Tax=Dipteronia dyeriana TaxID=168575 RepID=A0AAD9WX41_9ROSI|nr:hypothetical protein Ddye_020842 [Dipteronia dyeriana]